MNGRQTASRAHKLVASSLSSFRESASSAGLQLENQDPGVEACVVGLMLFIELLSFRAPFSYHTFLETLSFVSEKTSKGMIEIISDSKQLDLWRYECIDNLNLQGKGGHQGHSGLVHSHSSLCCEGMCSAL